MIVNKIVEVKSNNFKVYTFYIEGISRACLQELVRHRAASLTVKSTRYTLKELLKVDNKNLGDYLVETGSTVVNELNKVALRNIKNMLKLNMPFDVVKYTLPEAYKTTLIWTIEKRGLDNFIQLRTSPHALLEIKNLAYKIKDLIGE